ncbi:hypothetical protein [Mucilaginibacter sp. AK015]|uniref:hypothetical protein n=1 Tax=Mucilaginibacter sp. AK015 TaxID=2723072 RepID=UPI00161CE219|nr:hypothetical protein [Mucilaginibacter sp. AK015]MBB5395572.1 hypothetical protein [Mucilaginibacter sp. AK015]
MFKLFRLSLLALLCAGTFTASAQKIAQADSIQTSYANKQAKTFFFELLGPGAIYSINYDVRFKKQQDGWGGRAGISYYADNGDHLFTLPVAINYLAGKRGKYFEVGAGITYYNVNTNDVFFSTQYEDVYFSDGTYYTKSKNHSGIIGTLNFGYRYQPVDGGFSFRAGVSPVITSEQFLPYWPYVSFGYAF